MSAKSDKSDKTQIGLTVAGNDALRRIMEMEVFAAEGDAYKFAVAYALAVDLSPDPGVQGFKTKFNAGGGLDRDGVLRQLVIALAPDAAGARPYALAEQLAEAGIVDIDRRLTEQESMADIMAPLVPE